MKINSISIMKTLWAVMFVIITVVFIQTGVFAADNLYKPHGSDEKRDRQEDLYKEPDKSSNLYKPRKTRDREEDIYKAPENTSDIYKDKENTSDINKPDEKQEEQDRQKDIYNP